MCVGSAPSYSHGKFFDDIKTLSDYAMENNNIGFHIDACLEGFISAFLNLDEILDFRNKGGTASISIDIRKYGYSQKRTSVLLFRYIELRPSIFCMI